MKDDHIIEGPGAVDGRPARRDGCARLGFMKRVLTAGCCVAMLLVPVGCGPGESANRDEEPGADGSEAEDDELARAVDDITRNELDCAGVRQPAADNQHEGDNHGRGVPEPGKSLLLRHHADDHRNGGS